MGHRMHPPKPVDKVGGEPSRCWVWLKVQPPLSGQRIPQVAIGPSTGGPAKHSGVPSSRVVLMT